MIVLTGSAQVDFSQFMYGIEEAESIDDLLSMFPDDMVKTSESEFYMLVKENYQHVTVSIMVKIDNNNIAHVTFQPYD